jgi:hypothetical protein
VSLRVNKGWLTGRQEVIDLWRAKRQHIGKPEGWSYTRFSSWGL